MTRSLPGESDVPAGGARGLGLAIAPHCLPELSTHLVYGVANGWLVEDVLGGSLPELARHEVDRAGVRVAPRTVVHRGI